MPAATPCRTPSVPRTVLSKKGEEKYGHEGGHRREDLDLENLALYLRCPYMGQWSRLTIRWRDCNWPSGASKSRRWTPTLRSERGRERRMQEKAWQKTE